MWPQGSGDVEAEKEGTRGEGEAGATGEGKIQEGPWERTFPGQAEVSVISFFIHSLLSRSNIF